jgi:PKD repeat protein
VLALSQSSQSARSHVRATRALLAGLLALVLGCLWVPAARGQATPDFTVNPLSPLVGEEATFTPAPSNVPEDATVEWQYEPGGPFVPEDTQTHTGTHTFAAAGPYEITMRVTNGGLPADYTETVVVRPVAAFHRIPDDSVILTVGDEATFESDSTAGAALSWEIDGVAFGSEESVTHSFATSGFHVIRLEVVQNGVHAVATSTFRINAPPIASFIWASGGPVSGGEVQLYSTSVDAEGPLASEAWDLDGDGQFDDASGSSATHSFPAGDHNVSVLVTDGDGVSRSVTRTITVAAAQPTTTTTTPTTAPPALMKPFPTVRLAGLIVPRGARISLVEVRNAPRGARVAVRCTGDGCPFRLRRRIARTGRVRLSEFKRVLEAGARIQVFVRAPGVIGKYVGFRIRAGKRPLRTDRCLMPGLSRPTRCI